MRDNELFKFEVELSEQARKFMEVVTAPYDMSNVAYIKFVRSVQSHGMCRYPVKKAKSSRTEMFRLAIYLPEVNDRTEVSWIKSYDFVPITPQYIKKVELMQPYAVRVRFSRLSYGTVDRWEGENVYYNVFEFKARETEYESVENLDQNAVWIFGHEMYHFLRKSRQIPGRNNQNQADRFGIEILRTYKQHLKLASMPKAEVV